MILKKCHTELFNFITKLCDEHIIDNRSIGIHIRAFHINAPSMMLLIAIFAPKSIVIINIIFLIIIILLFILFDGCILSRIEDYLCKDNYNIVDPFLQMMKMERNNITTKIFSGYVMSCYMYVFLLLFYFRFYINK